MVELRIHRHSFRNVSMNFCSWQKYQSLTFLICPFTAWKGNTKSARSIIPLLQFHTLYKAEFKALSTSIIKGNYTKKYIYLQKHTQPVIFPWFCVLYILKLFNSPTIFISQHCEGGHLVQLLTATDYQWCD